MGFPMVFLWLFYGRLMAFCHVLPMFSYENRRVFDSQVRNDGFWFKITCTASQDRLDTWKLWGNSPETARWESFWWVSMISIRFMMQQSFQDGMQ
jgi:hypothetical protein